jgi:hypothetical protein
MRIIVTALFLISSIIASSQKNNPQFLKEPAIWEFERFALPPIFNPSFHYKGVEELRFAPGMFKKDSADYFTYVFVAELDNTTSISEQEVKNYLWDYYKGLCAATAKDRKLTIDTSKISVIVSKSKKAKEGTYNASQLVWRF